MQVIRTKDRDLLREVFRRDPIESMYMAGDLDEPTYSKCEWFASIVEGRPTAVVLIYSGLSLPAVLATGDLDGVRGILAASIADLPDRFHTKVDDRQAVVFREYSEFAEPETLNVMSLEALRPAATAPGISIRMLQAGDSIREITALYDDYPGNFFEPSQLAHNVYCGAWENGELAAIAGTHAFAPRERVAVLGNVVTASRRRGRGLCSQTCTFLIDELQRRGCEFIGLHVAESNHPAIRCYESIGFAPHSRLLQTLANKHVS